MADDLRLRGALRGTDSANIAGVSAATVSRWLAARAAPRTRLLIADLRYVVERPAAPHRPHAPSPRPPNSWHSTAWWCRARGPIA